MTVVSSRSSSSSEDSLIRLMANIFISFIGAGILGLPYAFKRAGLVEGTITMAVVCFLSIKAMLLLMDCRNKVAETHSLVDLGNGVCAFKKSKKTREYNDDEEEERNNNNGGDGGSGWRQETLLIGEEHETTTRRSVKEVVDHPEEEYGDDKTGLLEEQDESSSLPHSILSPSHAASAAAAAQHKPRNISYSDVAYVAFGTKGRLIVDSALLVTQVGFCCSYLIFISENLATFLDSSLDSHELVGVLLVPLFLLTLIPDLNDLALFSMLAQISNLFAFTVVFWFDFEHLNHISSAMSEGRQEFNIAGFPFFFSVAIYCFEGAGMILPLEASVSDRMRPHFRRYFVRTLASVTVLYIAFGVSGYLSYGETTRDIITLNLTSDSGIDFAAVVKACLCFSLFFTYPVMLFPVTSLLHERLHPFLPSSSSSSLYPHILIRLGLVALTGAVVMYIPKFADLMALIGASCCTLLAFVMPGLCHLVICRRRKDQINATLNYVLVIIGGVGAVVGTHDALGNIM